MNQKCPRCGKPKGDLVACSECISKELKASQDKMIEYQTRLMEMWGKEKCDAIGRRLAQILEDKIDSMSAEELAAESHRYLTPGAGEFWAYGGRIIMHSQMFLNRNAGQMGAIFQIDFLDEPDDEDSRRKLITKYTPSHL